MSEPDADSKILDKVLFIVLKWISRRIDEGLKISDQAKRIVGAMAELVDEAPVEFVEVDPETWEPLS